MAASSHYDEAVSPLSPAGSGIVFIVGRLPLALPNPRRGEAPQTAEKLHQQIVITFCNN
jgi:hypothetical protein